MPHPLLRTGRLLALCCCAALANTAAVAGEALDVRIGYLDYRPDPGPLLSNVIPEPDDAGLRGAELAITDSNTTGRFLNHNYQLTARNSDSPEHLLDDARALRNDGLRLFIVNAPDDSLRQLAEALPDSLLINAGSASDELRTTTCHCSHRPTITTWWWWRTSEATSASTCPIRPGYRARWSAPKA